MQTNDTQKLNQTVENRVRGRWVHSIKTGTEWRSVKVKQNCSSDDADGGGGGGGSRVKIIVVRNPLDRLVSAWRDKFGSIGDAADQGVKWYYYVRNSTTHSEFKTHLCLLFFIENNWQTNSSEISWRNQ